MAYITPSGRLGLPPLGPRRPLTPQQTLALQLDDETDVVLWLAGAEEVRIISRPVGGEKEERERERREVEQWLTDLGILHDDQYEPLDIPFDLDGMYNLIPLSLDHTKAFKKEGKILLFPPVEQLYDIAEMVWEANDKLLAEVRRGNGKARRKFKFTIPPFTNPQLLILPLLLTPLREHPLSNSRLKRRLLPSSPSSGLHTLLGTISPSGTWDAFSICNPSNEEGDLPSSFEDCQFRPPPPWQRPINPILNFPTTRSPSQRWNLFLLIIHARLHLQRLRARQSFAGAEGEGEMEISPNEELVRKVEVLLDRVDEGLMFDPWKAVEGEKRREVLSELRGLGRWEVEEKEKEAPREERETSEEKEQGALRRGGNRSEASLSEGSEVAEPIPGVLGAGSAFEVGEGELALDRASSDQRWEEEQRERSSALASTSTSSGAAEQG
ncbi:hypothetical protein BCR35DRAFT_300976 [Leucosporidium creatinivorum]|uniref:Uncharacterized protein n=1 Tax=Leucosporidium creatinivorum TaxID=106004 RepID=A0A1Y2FYP6_9BASI|nr:hypothetical protein BCR35DRAFT_300976 [Leucosporidium creatinivorum]